MKRPLYNTQCKEPSRQGEVQLQVLELAEQSDACASEYQNSCSYCRLRIGSFHAKPAARTATYLPDFFAAFFGMVAVVFRPSCALAPGLSGVLPWKRECSPSSGLSGEMPPFFISSAAIW